MLPGKSASITEFVDVFPTLCDLSGLAIPAQLDGKSLKPIMKDKNASVGEFAISQYPRSLKAKDMEKEGMESGDIMGYSIRTEKYRYTIWMKNFFSTIPFDEKLVYDTELYDYVKDPLETVNVAGEIDYKTVVMNLNEKLLAFFKTQEDKNKE